MKNQRKLLARKINMQEFDPGMMSEVTKSVFSI